MVESLPPPRTTRHHRSLLWWLVVGAVVALFVYWQTPRPNTLPSHRNPRTETDAFLALSFDRISETTADSLPVDALPAAVFRDQIAALKQGGYTVVGLEDVDAFLHRQTPLPVRPVVLLFTEAQRETMEIADATLAPLGMRGVVFVNVGGIEEGNTDLVSRHRLSQLSSSGRWDVAVDGNSVTIAPDENEAPKFSSENYARCKKLLEDLLERPVLAAGYQRRRLDVAGDQAWAQMLQATSFNLGFVSGPPQANYRDVSPLRLRSLKPSKAWRSVDMLSHLAAQMPRREVFQDDFASPAPSADWVVDHGEIAIENGALKISSKEGGTGALVAVAGTERWGDAAVVVELAGPPHGQFWLSLRGQKSGALLRLGVAAGRVVLQTSELGGHTHIVGSREMPRGKIVLGLRLLGGRAVAELNDQRLSERPAQIPAELQEGPVALAVWNEDGEASARIRRIAAEPLTMSLALVPAVPDSSAWGELRKRADEFAIVSPRPSGNRQRRAGDRALDPAIAIFARYHCLWVFPALTVERGLGPADAQRITAEALRWTDEPGVRGVNLIIAPDAASEKPVLALVSSLRSALAAKHKPLTVTLPGATAAPKSLEALVQVFLGPEESSSRLEAAIAPLRLVGPRT